MLNKEVFIKHRKNVFSMMLDNSVLIQFSRKKEESDVNSKLDINRNYYYLSVPETSTIEVEDKELSKKIQSSDSLISLAKEEILDMLMDSCKDVFGDDEEFLEEVKNNTSDYFKFYAKVRKGETWNKELGDAMVKKLTDEIHATSAYKEV